jgi:hypothetical protein
MAQEDGVTIPAEVTPDTTDHTPPEGVAVSAVCGLVLQKGLIGLITGIGGSNTDTFNTVELGHTVGSGVEKVLYTKL